MMMMMKMMTKIQMNNMTKCHTKNKKMKNTLQEENESDNITKEIEELFRELQSDEKQK